MQQPEELQELAAPPPPPPASPAPSAAADGEHMPPPPTPPVSVEQVDERPPTPPAADATEEVGMNIAGEEPAVEEQEQEQEDKAQEMSQEMSHETGQEMGQEMAQGNSEDQQGQAQEEQPVEQMHEPANGRSADGLAAGNADSSVLGKRTWGARDQDAFEIIHQIGQGTFGQVYKARDRRDNTVVALKKINMEQEREGFPITAIREIKILKNLKHPNIVDLREVIVSSRERPDEGNVYMVFEYVDYDLTGLMDSPGVVLSELHIKTYMLQLLTGTMVMHKNHIIHRDLKGPNLLITKDGCLKIADWGLARSYYTNEVRYTNRVITLWYRPPELLLGAEHYGPAVDMWSIGCLFGEMKVRKAILQGNDEPHQLELIYKLCGTPNDEHWPAARDLPKWGEMQFSQTYEPTIDQRFAEFNRTALSLLKALLEMDPAKRITAEEALNHDYFWTEPLPIRDPKDLHLLPRFNLEEAHEWETKRRLEEQKRAGRAGGGGGGRDGGGRGGDRAPPPFRGRGPPPPFRGRGRGPPPPFRSGGGGRGGGGGGGSGGNSWHRESAPFRR